jgi:hypothetical protein
MHGFHIFRNTGGSIVRAQTGDIKLAQVQLSHAQLSTTSDVYVHTNEDDLRRAAEALAGMFQKFLPTNLPLTDFSLPTRAGAVAVMASELKEKASLRKVTLHTM